MSERKGINKYYPPDYDPSKVPKRQKVGNQDLKIRMMAPYSMRCLKCNEYIAERRKFNAKKEITKETYMNVKIIRFHITCPRCNNSITFKTSPQTAGYVPESGAVRNYEPMKKVADIVPKDRAETEDEILERLEKEELEDQSYQMIKEKRKRNPFWQKDEGLKGGDGDIMANLEKKLQQQQKEHEINEHLEQLQARQEHIRQQGGDENVVSTAQERITNEIAQLEKSKNEIFDKEDSELAKRAFANFRNERDSSPSTVDASNLEKSSDETNDKSPTIVVEEEEEDVVSELPETQKIQFKPKIIIKKKKLGSLTPRQPSTEPTKESEPNNLSNIKEKIVTPSQTNNITALNGYSSSSDEE
ncbi:splicing factor Yju2p [[Candida] anglica]|uniref:Splicing factor YJU2 n=1 Tax=[Candida] anglica TaxID=148631 RepID=A0ABP0EB60_9ASCO